MNDGGKVMRPCVWASAFLTALTLQAAQVVSSNAPNSTNSPIPSARVIREPAVAGLFYPKDAGELGQMLDKFLSAAPAGEPGDLKAIVCPHAGYEFSGPTAAYAYKKLVGRKFETVVILGPSHYAALDKACVSAADAYRSPLGDVPVSPRARALAKLDLCQIEQACLMRRPPWWRQASKPAPATGKDTADTWEHSLEVQIPFLQKVLTNFSILPVVLGDVDPARVAGAIAQVLDDRTLLVVSSDLSHYHPYAEAKKLDQACVQAVCNLDIHGMTAQEACGKTPLLTLLHLAKQKGWRARLLDYRNSGDTAGSKGNVVGYAAIAFFAPTDEKFSASERKQLLELAQRALKQAVVSRTLVPETNAWPARFHEHRGCFVTLTKAGELRGCIGHIFPMEQLGLAVQENAQSAALRDLRFPTVRPEELSQIEIEVSVLTEPRPLSFSSPEDLLAKLQPGRDGVVLRVNGRVSTFLPQVWSQLPEKVGFLNQLSMKAGAAPDDWRKPGTQVLTYQVEAFKAGE